jgi:hypothetical protein
MTNDVKFHKGDKMKDERFNWKKFEINFLKKKSRFYSLKEMMEILKRSKQSIAMKLSRLRLRTKNSFFQEKVQLSETQKAYIAGAIDGEGCVSFSRNTKKRYITPLVVIANTNLKWIQSFKIDTKVGSVSEHKTHLWKKNWKPVYNYRLSSEKARWILREVFPYLRLKREQAKVLLALPKAYKRTNSLFRKREKLLDKMHKLNQRGLH